MRDVLLQLPFLLVGLLVLAVVLQALGRGRRRAQLALECRSPPTEAVQDEVRFALTYQPEEAQR
jgi:hypothetical protein